MSKKRVTLARDYKDADGKNHKADAEVELPRHEANDLLHLGLARVPDEKPAAGAEKKG